MIKLFKKKEIDTVEYDIKQNFITAVSSQVVSYTMSRITESLNLGSNYCIIYFDDFTHFKNYCNERLSVDRRVNIFESADRLITKKEQNSIIKNIFIKNIKKINNIILLKKCKIKFHRHDYLFDIEYAEITWKNEEK